MMQNLRTATVAACTGVVGRSLVEQLVGDGTRVIGFVRAGAERDAGDLVEKAAGKLTVLGGDMTDAKSCENLVRAAYETLGGPLDAHFHAAGSYDWVTWSEATPEAVEKLWSSNYTTAWMMGREVFRVMGQHGGGSLVFVSNRDTLTVARQGMGPYLAPKAALNMLVQSLAAEGASRGIRVNAVLPGIIDTSVNRRAMPDQDPDRWVNPRRLADLMIDLAHRRRSDVSGALIPVPGKML